MSGWGRALAVAGVALLLAGCATSPPPAVVTYTGANCASAPDLASAVDLTQERRREAYTVVTQISAASPCVQVGGANRPYVVYAIPTSERPRLMSVGGSLEFSRIFAAEVSTLDANGAVVRSFDRTQYAYRSLTYSAQFRPRDNEAYVLVTADPALVGQTYEAIQIGISTTATATPTGAISWTYGTDNSHSRSFSYEGAAVVSVYNEEAD